MKLLCQILIMVIGITSFFGTLHSDFNGRTAKTPFGFSGAVITITLFLIGTVVYVAAGAFSEIIGLFR